MKARFRLGKLPSELEELALKHDLEHEEVGMDAIYAYTHYRREHGFDDKKSYELTMQHLNKKYSAIKNNNMRLYTGDKE